MPAGYNPGDVVLDYVHLGGIAAISDVSRRVQKFSIFEDVKKPYISCEMDLLDVTDILNKNIGLDGANSLKLSFHQSGQGAYVFSGTVFTVEKSRSLQNQRAAHYKLQAYSSHLANQQKVQKSFQSVPATDVAASLVGMLGTKKPLSIRAPARGMVGNSKMPFNINGVGIFKGIRSALQRGASTKDQSSAYLFFENRHNMVIDTLENMLNSAKRGGVGPYFQRPMGQDWHRDVASQNFTILSYREDTRIDKTQQIQTGSQESRTYDLFAHTFEKAAASFGGAGGGAASYNNIPYHIMRPPTFMKSVMGPRKFAASVFDSQSLTIHVALNPDLTVGHAFKVDSLAPPGDTSEAVRDNIAGSFLAVEVRHTVDLSKIRMQGTSTARGISTKNHLS